MAPHEGIRSPVGKEIMLLKKANGILQHYIDNTQPVVGSPKQNNPSNNNVQPDVQSPKHNNPYLKLNIKNCYKKGKTNNPYEKKHDDPNNPHIDEDGALHMADRTRYGINKSTGEYNTFNEQIEMRVNERKEDKFKIQMRAQQLRKDKGLSYYPESAIRGFVWGNLIPLRAKNLMIIGANDFEPT